MRILIAVLIVAGLAAPAAGARALNDGATAPARAVCADFPNQAAAQRAANTVDADGDGIYCESLPCPCLGPGVPNVPTPTPTAPSAPTATATPVPTAAPTATPTPVPADGCQRPSVVQTLTFSKTKYPGIRRHVQRAIRKGWPAVLVLNRDGATERRNRLMRDWPNRTGKGRDEYPPAIGRGIGTGLTAGSKPRGWKADIAYVRSSENRAHAAVLGDQLEPFCDGTRFQYRFK